MTMKELLFFIMFSILSLNHAFAENVELRWKGADITLEPKDGKKPFDLDPQRGSDWKKRRVPAGSYTIVNVRGICTVVSEFVSGHAYQILSSDTTSICKVGKAIGP